MCVKVYNGGIAFKGAKRMASRKEEVLAFLDELNQKNDCG